MVVMGMSSMAVSVTGFVVVRFDVVEVKSGCRGRI
jgi:hypothetical protein